MYRRQVYFFQQNRTGVTETYVGQSVVEEVYSTKNYTSSLLSGKNVKTCFTFYHKTLKEPCILVEMYRCFWTAASTFCLEEGGRTVPRCPTIYQLVYDVSIPRNTRACKDLNHLRQDASSPRRFGGSGFFTSRLLSNTVVEGKRSNLPNVTA